MVALYFANFLDPEMEQYHIKKKRSSAKWTCNYTNISAFAEMKYLEMLTFVIIFHTYF